MKQIFRRSFIAVLALLVFTQVHVGFSNHQLAFSLVQAAEANSCTSVNPAGNWGAAGTWTNCGGVAPTLADTCAISGTGTITVESSVAGTDVCGATTFSGFTGTLNQAAGHELDIYGSFTLVSGMTYTAVATSITKFKATSGTSVITTAGKLIGGITFDGVGGTFQFADNVTTTSGVVWTLTNGTADFNGKTINTASNPFSFSSSNSNTRSLLIGAGTVNLVDTTSTTVWDIGTSTGMTLSAASSTITINESTQTTVFNGGGLTYGTVSDTQNTTGSLTINGANTFGNLTLSDGGAATGEYFFGANQTVSGTFTFNSNSLLNRDYLVSTVKGTARTITAAAISSNGADLQDITGAGAATWNLSGTTFGGGDCGGNSGITFNTPKNVFMKTAVSTNWSTTGQWKTTSGGVTEITPDYPLPQDTAKFDANSVTASGKTITIDASAVRLPAMDWTGVLNTPALAFTTAASYFGSITLVSVMTVSGTGIMTLEGRSNPNFTSGGLTLTAEMDITSPNSTWTQQDNLTNNRSSSAMRFVSGTWASGSHNITLTGALGAFAVQGGNYTGSGTISITGTSGASFNISAGDANISNGTISITGASSTMPLTGGTLEVGTLTRTGFTITIQGTAVQIGTGGAAYGNAGLVISSGSLAATTGNKITSVSNTAIAVSAATTGGGSCAFGDAGSWIHPYDAIFPANDNWNLANDNVRYRRAM